jgi:hypothetical protein
VQEPAGVGTLRGVGETVHVTLPDQPAHVLAS